MKDAKKVSLSNQVFEKLEEAECSECGEKL